MRFALFKCAVKIKKIYIDMHFYFKNNLLIIVWDFVHIFYEQDIQQNTYLFTLINSHDTNYPLLIKNGSSVIELQHLIKNRSYVIYGELTWKTKKKATFREKTQK